MQDITKAKCDSSSIPTGTEGRLIDKRDNKVYWVAKLKDGLCWMTQNLDYDGGGTGTDAVTLTAGTNFASSTQSSKLYYNPGEYVYTNSTTVSSCNDATTSTGLEVCTGNGWKIESGASNADVDELTDITNWMSTDDTNFIGASSYPSMDGKETCAKAVGSLVGNPGQYIYCNVYYYTYKFAYEHYLVGNYYNWMAATNGAKTSTGAIVENDGDEAVGSICPTGWKLPLSGDSNSNKDGSFNKLLNGFTNTQATLAPYYFVHGGNVRDTRLNNASSLGVYWSAIARSNTVVYTLVFDSNNYMSSSNGNYESYYGYSVRCVAR